MVSKDPGNARAGPRQPRARPAPSPAAAPVRAHLGRLREQGGVVEVRQARPHARRAPLHVGQLVGRHVCEDLRQPGQLAALHRQAYAAPGWEGGEGGAARRQGWARVSGLGALKAIPQCAGALRGHGARSTLPPSPMALHPPQPPPGPRPPPPAPRRRRRPARAPLERARERRVQVPGAACHVNGDAAVQHGVLKKRRPPVGRQHQAAVGGQSGARWLAGWPACFDALGFADLNQTPNPKPGARGPPNPPTTRGSPVSAAGQQKGVVSLAGARGAGADAGVPGDAVGIGGRVGGGSRRLGVGMGGPGGVGAGLQAGLPEGPEGGVGAKVLGG
jgi:hypothetical protein